PIKTNRRKRDTGIGDTGVWVQTKAFTSLFEGFFKLADGTVASREIGARNKVAGIRLLPELLNLDVFIAIPLHIHVVTRRNVKSLALAGAPAKIKGFLRELSGKVVLLSCSVCDREGRVCNRKVGIQLDSVPVKRNRLIVLPAELALPAE